MKNGTRNFMIKCVEARWLIPFPFLFYKVRNCSFSKIKKKKKKNRNSSISRQSLANHSFLEQGITDNVAAPRSSPSSITFKRGIRTTNLPCHYSILHLLIFPRATGFSFSSQSINPSPFQNEPFPPREGKERNFPPFLSSPLPTR